MSTGVTLRAERRADHGKGAARKLRAQGRVPAVLYGKGTETLSLSVDAHEAGHLFQAISVENTIVELTIEGEQGPNPTLVREIQVHPYRPTLLHVDFYRVREGVMIDVEIPIHLIGIPDGVKNAGGILQQTIHELPVRCLPIEIPESIELDVSGLEIGGALHVSDIELGEKVEVLVEAERMVCSVALPRVVAEPTEVEEDEEAEAEASEEPSEEGGEEEEEEED